MKWPYAVIIAGVILWSCKHTGNYSGYKYEANFFSFLNKAFDLSPESVNDKFIFVIPVNSCSPCVEKTLGFLALPAHHHVVGLILANSKKDLIRYKEIIEGNNNGNLYYDLAAIHANYELGIFGPVLIYVQNNQVKTFAELSLANFDSKIEQLYKNDSPEK